MLMVLRQLGHWNFFRFTVAKNRPQASQWATHMDLPQLAHTAVVASPSTS
jgi:hypothetical protein